MQFKKYSFWRRQPTLQGCMFSTKSQDCWDRRSDIEWTTLGIEVHFSVPWLTRNREGEFLGKVAVFWIWLDILQMSYDKTCRIIWHTVDGWNPAPVYRQFIPLFIGFHTSQVVQDFSHQQYHLEFAVHASGETVINMSHCMLYSGSGTDTLKSVPLNSTPTSQNFHARLQGLNLRQETFSMYL